MSKEDAVMALSNQLSNIGASLSQIEEMFCEQSQLRIIQLLNVKGDEDLYALDNKGNMYKLAITYTDERHINIHSMKWEKLIIKFK